MRTVEIHFEEKSYPIFLDDNWEGLFQKAGGYLKSGSALIISDENVSALYCREIENRLRELGVKTFTATVSPGEASKSLQTAEELYTKALQAGLDRSSQIIALGGGVIGDLAGFIASTYMRGIHFVQIPTSLLAQVDSSIGGKVAINHPLAKNIIGSFYQPKCVLMNIRTLATLPRRELAAGMAELIKHGIIRDEELLAWLENNMVKIMEPSIDLLTEGIYRSCKIKADVVSQDEKEHGLRAILNFGHTIGHAVEAASGYGACIHGEAVSIGMVAEAYLSKILGLVDDEYVARIKQTLSRAGLPVHVPDLDSSRLLELMRHDKKNTQGKIVFVLPVGPGKVEIFRDVETETILAALEMARQPFIYDS
jgi:3-dehydroquinate synthase